VEEGSQDSSVIMFSVPHSDPPIFFEPARFLVQVKLPTNGHFFFCTPQTLADLGDLVNGYFPVLLLSDYTNAMVTRGYGHTTSPYYKAPYFLVFRTSQQGITSNFHMFNDFNVAPSLGHILAILHYDDNIDKFQPTEYFDLQIPFQNAYSLSNTLEFFIQDSNRKTVQFRDQSQLFVSVSTL
jgi:hypothetical protein